MAEVARVLGEPLHRVVRRGGVGRGPVVPVGLVQRPRIGHRLIVPSGRGARRAAAGTVRSLPWPWLRPCTSRARRSNGFHIGPAYIHFYGLMYVIGITLAILITQRRWKALGGDVGLVGDVAIWAVPAGIVGGRIYFDLTTPKYIPHHWYGAFAVWDGGLGIWGGVALAAVVGAWRVRRTGASVSLFMDAVAPALLVAQAIGRVGNYFNQELFGGPTTLPWGTADRAAVPADRLPPVQHVPADLPVRADLRPGLGRAPGLARPPPRHQAARPVRAVRLRVLGVPDVRGVAPGGPVRALPRPAAEHVRRRRAHPGRPGLVRVLPAPRPPRQRTARHRARACPGGPGRRG